MASQSAHQSTPLKGPSRLACMAASVCNVALEIGTAFEPESAVISDAQFCPLAFSGGGALEYLGLCATKYGTSTCYLARI